MHIEDDLRRPPPPRPYQPGNATLRVPAQGLAATLALLRRAGKRESGLFWYGQRDAMGNGEVAYIVAPRQRMTWGNYHISAEALAEIVHRLPDAWKPLAQIHSHPGSRVEHSNYDDRMASSRNALSLVFPSYGHGGEQFPSGVGVHEWQNGYWHLLGLSHVATRVMICSGNVKVADLR